MNRKFLPFSIIRRTHISPQFKNILKPGFKLILIPIFIISLAAIFGFRNQSYSDSNKLLLFDACLDYIRSNSTIDSIDLKQDLLDLTGSSNNVQSNKLIPIIPDSTVKPIQPVKIDSVKIHVLAQDSSIIKAKQDSLKRIENHLKKALDESKNTTQK